MSTPHDAPYKLAQRASEKSTENPLTLTWNTKEGRRFAQGTVPSLDGKSDYTTDYNGVCRRTTVEVQAKAAA